MENVTNVNFHFRIYKFKEKTIKTLFCIHSSINLHFYILYVIMLFVFHAKRGCKYKHTNTLFIINQTVIESSKSNCN